MAADICKILGVSAEVAAHADAKKALKLVKAQPGESFWALLQREAAKHQLLPTVTPDGGLVLGKPDYTSAPVATLHMGGPDADVLSASYTATLSGRFSHVLVTGQAAGDAFSDGAKLKGSAQDKELIGMGLYRPAVVDAGGDLRGHAEANARAAWEVSYRAYQGEVLEVEVVGHGPGTGKVWAPNTQVNVVDDVMGLSGLWWLSGRRLTRDRTQGTRAALTLHRPGTLLPPVAP